MTPLDELRALASATLADQLRPTCKCPACQLARAVLAMTPLVEAAVTYFAAIDAANVEGRKEPPSAQDDPFMHALAEQGRTFHLLQSAVAAFRAANREGETKAT